MHVGSIQFRVLGFIAVGTICSLIACSGGSSNNPTISTVGGTTVSLSTPIIAAPAQVVLGNTDVTASVQSPQTDATYTWTVDGGTIQGSTTGSSVLFSADQAGTLTVSVMATMGSESRRGTHVIQVQNNPPLTPQLVVPANVSTGATGLQASVSAPQGGVTYAWTIQDGTITSGAGSSQVTFTAGAAGTITLVCKATNTVGSTSSQASVVVVPLAPLTPGITAPNSTTAASTNNIASVPPQSGCNYTWSLTNGTLTSGQGTPSVAFTAGAAGTAMTLGITLTNSAAVSASNTASIAVLAATAPPPVVPPAGTTTGYYGSQINADDIANIVIGWNPLNDTMNRVASYRLRATHTGTLKSIRPFFIWSDVKPGYNLGDGGTIQIQVQTDDGTSSHNPSGTTIASLVYDHPVPPYNTNHWPLLTFATPANLTSGTLYHLVFSNISADPKANWVSLDCLWKWNAFTQIQPTVTNTDMNILEKNSAGAWVVYNRGAATSITPVIELDYADGVSQGQGYIQGFGSPDPSFVNPKPISGTQAVRETFTVSGANKSVTAVSMRMNRVSGSSPLTATVETAAGVVVGQGTVMVPAGGTPTYTFNPSVWVRVAFATPLTLQAGTAYHLLLTSPADTVHSTHVLAKGSTYGYTSGTLFGDGSAQYNDGTGWTGGICGA